MLPIISASDRRIWFAESGTSKLGAIDTNGFSLQEYPTQAASETPHALLDRGDGTIWYTTLTNNLGYQTITGDSG